MGVEGPFEFHDAGIRFSSEEYVANVPPGLSDARSLLVALKEVLRLPDYFGFNWNALDEVLGDFHWMSERTIVIRHSDLPRLPDSELRIYLDSLADAVRGWREGGEHSLRVVFPQDARSEIDRLVGADST